MCGFVGMLQFDHHFARPAIIDSMLHHIAPRGPDGYGIWLQGGFGCGHRRLQIIDLSHQSEQPMIDKHLGLTLVFNGTIYNYPQLRKELQQLGYRFFSRGDTEVILKAYHAWGAACVQRFNGMFAFAIWEHAAQRLFLARDRLGIKPLYYAQTSKGLYFASTLPALLEVPDIDKSLDPVSLNYYMFLHAIVPAPGTMIKGIRKLEPGHTMLVHKENGKMHKARYWHLDYSQNHTEILTTEEWQEELLILLTKAVKRRLVADVPVGVLLSGGLDSSLLVGLLAEMGYTPETFSIGFASVHKTSDPEHKEDGHEYVYSDLIARHYQTRHHSIFVSDKELLQHLHGAIQAMSEPMVSHDVVGFYLLGKEVCQHTKVVQSGQGADEVFAGYHWYPKLAASSHASLVTDYAQYFFDRDFAGYSQAVTAEWVQEDYTRSFVQQHFSRLKADQPVDKALHLDTTVMLVEDPVKRVDNMTMHWGLEARVPFLDHELVEFAARIPSKLKIAQGGKHILKEVARKIIPHAVIDRPKGYFPVPALKYLAGPYLQQVQEVLLSRQAQQRKLFRPDYLHQLLQNPQEYITPLGGSKLWQMAALELWLQANQL